MKNLLLIVVLALSFNVNADYVYNAGDDFFTNDVNGQEWLRLDQTFSMSFNDALAANAADGYRSATKAEMDGLLDFFLTPFGGRSTLWAPFVEETKIFEQVVGTNVYEYSVGAFVHKSIALFKNDTDGANIVTMVGTDYFPATGRVYFYDTDDGFQYIANQQYVGFSSWLVKEPTHTPEVPIPPAVWLFGSGLIGLVAVGRRKV